MAKIVDLETVKKQPKKATKKTTVKKTNSEQEYKQLTLSELMKHKEIFEDKKTFTVEVNGEKLSYTIDTHATTYKKSLFANEAKSIAWFLSEELKNNDDDMEIIIQGLMITSILKIFTDVEVPEPLADRASFLSLLADLGILEQIIANIPETLSDVFTYAEEEMQRASELVEKQKQVLAEIEGKIDDLEKEKTETETETETEHIVELEEEE